MTRIIFVLLNFLLRLALIYYLWFNGCQLECWHWFLEEKFFKLSENFFVDKLLIEKEFRDFKDKLQRKVMDNTINVTRFLPSTLKKMYTAYYHR